MAATNLDAAIYMDNIINDKQVVGDIPTEYKNLLTQFDKRITSIKKAYQNLRVIQVQIMRIVKC